jgi:hypothetical protein
MSNAFLCSSLAKRASALAEPDAKAPIATPRRCWMLPVTQHRDVLGGGGASRESVAASSRASVYFAGCQPWPSRFTCPSEASLGSTRYR